MPFLLPSSNSSTGSRYFRCSAMAKCDDSPSMWKMLGRRSQRYCNANKLARTCSNAVVLASTPTRSFLESSRTQPGSSPYYFPYRWPLGALWLGFLKCCRVHQSRGISPHSVEEMLQDLLSSH